MKVGGGFLGAILRLYLRDCSHSNTRSTLTVGPQRARTKDKTRQIGTSEKRMDDSSHDYGLLIQINSMVDYAIACLPLVGSLQGM